MSRSRRPRRGRLLAMTPYYKSESDRLVREAREDLLDHAVNTTTISAMADQLAAATEEIERLTKLVQVSPDDIAAVVGENDRMQRAFSEAMVKLKAGMSVRFSSCEW